MKYKCQRCEKECNDNYKNVNKLNVRIWCDDCVEIIKKNYTGLK